MPEYSDSSTSSDDFKQVNDQFGHNATVFARGALRMKHQLRVATCWRGSAEMKFAR